MKVYQHNVPGYPLHAIRDLKVGETFVRADVEEPCTVYMLAKAWTEFGGAIAIDVLNKAMRSFHRGHQVYKVECELHIVESPKRVRTER